MSRSGISFGSRLAAAVIDRSPDWSSFYATQAMGAAARLRLPSPVIQAAIGAYSKVFNVDMSDVDPEVARQGYPSFDAFFTRPLRAGARPLDDRDNIIVAPSDGLLRGVVPCDSGAQVLAKEHAYTLSELLTDGTLAHELDGGLMSTIYLHPRDYHRVHCPVNATVRRVIAVPGRLLPVTDAALGREPQLFALNERLIHVLDTDHGPVVVVMVAAFGVGNMSCAYTPVQTHPSKIQDIELSEPIQLHKGDELGAFHLGSTVILLTAKGSSTVDSKINCPVRFGESVLQWGEGV